MLTKLVIPEWWWGIAITGRGHTTKMKESFLSWLMICCGKTECDLFRPNLWRRKFGFFRFVSIIWICVCELHTIWPLFVHFSLHPWRFVPLSSFLNLFDETLNICLSICTHSLAHAHEFPFCMLD